MQQMMWAIIAFCVVFGAAVSMVMAERRQAQLVPVRIKRTRR